VGLKATAAAILLPFTLILPTLYAAPALRLSTAAVGPVSIAAGANGSAQTVEAANIGDGSLTLAVSAADSWLTPSIGDTRPCTASGFSGSCIPVQIGLQTSGLAKGIYTGIVTVSDPNAVDAPQDITVTVQIGGGVPDQLDLYVPPDGSFGTAFFSTNSMLNASLATDDGQRWLSFTLTGTGSFRFSFPYRIAARQLPDMPEGAYTGSVTTFGSSFTPDNKTIGVTMHLNSQPIAQAAPDALVVRMAQGAASEAPACQAITISGDQLATRLNSCTVTLTNTGLGTLAISDLNPATGGNWLGASSAGLTISIAIDATGLTPGTYQGSLAVSSNAINSPTTIPVTLEVVPQSAPAAAFQGVTDDATFDPTAPLAPGGLAIVNGEQFTFGGPAQATPPLPQSLGGAAVLLNDQPVPLLSASYSQIIFQVPYETPPGAATLRVSRDGQAGNAVSINIVPLAPGIMRLGIGDYGVVVNADGSYAIPSDPATNNHPAHPGETVTVYGIGFGQTNPPAATGQPAPADEPLARLDPLPNVTIGGAFVGTPVTTQAVDAFLAPNLVGLYQISVVIPDDAPTGPSVPLTVSFAGSTTNTVRLAIDPPPAQ
jgi:uncharacterized protein (TIGR03437 family)